MCPSLLSAPGQVTCISLRISTCGNFSVGGGVSRTKSLQRNWLVDSPQVMAILPLGVLSCPWVLRERYRDTGGSHEFGTSDTVGRSGLAALFASPYKKEIS